MTFGEKKFSYTFDAKRAKEISNIVSKYNPPSSDNYEKIKELDKEVERPAFLVFWVLFLTGTLSFGMGLSLVLEYGITMLGTIIGLMGLLSVSISFPIKTMILNKRRNEYRSRILELTENLKDEGKGD